MYRWRRVIVVDLKCNNARRRQTKKKSNNFRITLSVEVCGGCFEAELKIINTQTRTSVVIKKKKKKNKK